MVEEEKKEPEETKPEEKVEVPEDVKLAREASAELKTQVAAMKLENDRRMKMLVRKELGGGTDAGQPSQPKEENDHDYRERITKEMAAGKTEFGN